MNELMYEASELIDLPETMTLTEPYAEAVNRAPCFAERIASLYFGELNPIAVLSLYDAVSHELKYPFDLVFHLSSKPYPINDNTRTPFLWFRTAMIIGIIRSIRDTTPQSVLQAIVAPYYNTFNAVIDIYARTGEKYRELLVPPIKKAASIPTPLFGGYVIDGSSTEVMNICSVYLWDKNERFMPFARDRVVAELLLAYFSALRRRANSFARDYNLL